MTAPSEPASLTAYVCYISIMAVLLLIIAIYHFRSIHMIRKDRTGKLPWSVSLSVLMILIAFIQWTDFILLLLPSVPGWYCFVQIHLGPMCYTSFKACLYIILLSRLWSRNSSKCQSIFNYNPIRIKVWSIIILSWSVINGVAMNIGGTAKFEGHDIFPKCTNDLSDISLAMSAGLDFVAGIVNLYLFVKPLFSILREVKDEELKSVVIKLCILSVFAVISTIISIIICANANGTAIFIFAVVADELISTLCIILMYQWNKWITDRILHTCLPSNVDIRNLEMTIGVASATTDCDTVTNSKIDVIITDDNDKNTLGLPNGGKLHGVSVSNCSAYSDDPTMINMESNMSVMSTMNQE